MTVTINSCLLPEKPGITPVQPELKPEKPDKRTRPQRCRHLLREPDPNTWDPETDTYPRNWAWEECMGVA